LHVTHLYNGMRGIHHREPGVLGASLLNQKLKAEITVDGIHVHPKMIEFAFKYKGADNLIAITDSNRAKYLEDDTYQIGGSTVIVKEGRAITSDGTLAGSVLKMNVAFYNLLKFTNCSIEDAIKMTSTNAAKQLSIFNERGSLKPSKYADIVILNDKFEVVMTFCKGILAYSNYEST